MSTTALKSHDEKTENKKMGVDTLQRSRVVRMSGRTETHAWGDNITASAKKFYGLTQHGKL